MTISKHLINTIANDPKYKGVLGKDFQHGYS